MRLKTGDRVCAMEVVEPDGNRLSVRYETFIEEFSNILQRQG